MSVEIKLFLLELNKYSISDLGKIDDTKINLIEIITLFETYIKHHLKLTKNIQSLKMVRDMAHG